MNAFSIRQLLMQVVLICALSRPAGAQIDQQYAPSDNTSEAYLVFNSFSGQSFTPGFTYLDFITISLRGFAPGDASGTLEIDLFAGEGFSGTQIGESAPIQATIPNSTTQKFEFKFAPIALTPGQLYSFRVRPLSGGGFALVTPVGASTIYTSGRAILNGTASDLVDFRFSEGISVPEPSTALLLIFSVFFLLETRTRPSHALQRTAPRVTAPASTATFPPTAQVPRRTPQSLSLGSLGDMRRMH